MKKKKAVPLAETFVDPAPLPDEIFERNNIKETLNAAMNQIAPQYRMVLFLRYNAISLSGKSRNPWENL